jgi:hypothetical protein
MFDISIATYKKKIVFILIVFLIACCVDYLFFRTLAIKNIILDLTLAHLAILKRDWFCINMCDEFNIMYSLLIPAWISLLTTVGLLILNITKLFVVDPLLLISVPIMIFFMFLIIDISGYN